MTITHDMDDLDHSIYFTQRYLERLKSDKIALDKTIAKIEKEIEDYNSKEKENANK
jgi:hypothetical protein